MGVPKRKTSRARQGKRRSHHGLKVPTLVKCERCKTLIEPHRVCPVCEHYKGVEYRILRPEKEEKK